ncbi:MAG: ATP-dependent sacrificial sulfur transferase LarE [Victivallaceae bacterium]|nr:ATP-dependent sacrificial sulfur transferase LarE [Victivallaceae bacterium]
MTARIEQLEKSLLDLAQSGGVALAFSGGVDSTLLLALLTRLHRTHPFSLAVFTMHSIFQKPEELARVRAIAEELHTLPPEIFEFDPLALPELTNNPPERCYYCKRAFFRELLRRANERGIPNVLDGTNADDLHVYRPGRRALAELKIHSVLAESGIGKAEIRAMAAELSLSVAALPASPCLATRFPYGTELSVWNLQQVAEGEAKLRGLLPDSRNLRLRVHGKIARIEVDPEQLSRLMEQRLAVLAALAPLGFEYITMDLGCFRSGSMDHVGGAGA